MHRPDPSTFYMYVICLVSSVQGRAMKSIVVLAGPANSLGDRHTRRGSAMQSGSTIWKKSFPGSGSAAAAMRLPATGLLVIILFWLGASRHQRCNNVVTVVTFATYVIIAVLSMCFCLVELMMKSVVFECHISYALWTLYCEFPTVLSECLKICIGHAKILQYLCLLTFHWLIITLTTVFLILNNISKISSFFSRLLQTCLVFELSSHRLTGFACQF
jgi:hypothetical protein